MERESGTYRAMWERQAAEDLQKRNMPMMGLVGSVSSDDDEAEPLAAGSVPGATAAEVAAAKE